MATRIQKDTANAMIGKLHGELDALFEHQEMGKGGRLKQKCCHGGRLKRRQMPDGGVFSNWLANNPMIPGSGTGIQFGQPGTGIQSPFATPTLGTQSTSNFPFFANIGANASGTNLPFFQRPWVKTAGNIGSNLAGLAPFFWNTSQALQPAEHLNYANYRNPEYENAMKMYNKAASLMANRRFNVNPLLREADRSAAIFNQGLRNTGSISSGQLRNELSGSSVRQYEQRSNARTYKQNADLGYLGENAQFLGNQAGFAAGLGAQDAAMRFNVDDYNLQSDAARRKMGAEAATNLQQWALMNRLMQNQQGRDQYLGNLANSMLANYMFDEEGHLIPKGYGG